MTKRVPRWWLGMCLAGVLACTSPRNSTIDGSPPTGGAAGSAAKGGAGGDGRGGASAATGGASGLGGSAGGAAAGGGTASGGAAGGVGGRASGNGGAGRRQRPGVVGSGGIAGTRRCAGRRDRRDRRCRQRRQWRLGKRGTGGAAGAGSGGSGGGAAGKGGAGAGGAVALAAWPGRARRPRHAARLAAWRLAGATGSGESPSPAVPARPAPARSGTAQCTCNANPICSATGATCVNPSLLAACVQDAQGCVYESQTETCTNGACTGNPGGAECCTNICTTGATQCSDGATLQTCGPMNTGCTDFVNSLCSSGLVCERSAAASCADPHWAEWRMPNDAADAAAGAPNGASYTNNQDGTVTDNVTSLMWQQTVPTTTFTWTDAGAHCPTLTLGGHGDWRLPTVIELIRSSTTAGRPRRSSTGRPSPRRRPRSSGQPTCTVAHSTSRTS